MLCRVFVRSLPANQLLANREDPNGLGPPRPLLRCGIDPALSRESRAAWLEADAPIDVAWSRSGGVPAWYGLDEGVTRPDLGSSEDCEPLREVVAGNREGTVPARARRAELAAEFVPDPEVACVESKSGKLSLPGDSGMVSRNGVEWPLPVVGGPHICGDSPSCAWISRALHRVSCNARTAIVAGLPGTFWERDDC